MKSKGFPYVFNSNYDVNIDKPDITIFYQLKYRYTDNLYSAYKYSKMVVLVPLTLTIIWYGKRSVSRMHLDKFQSTVTFAIDLVMEKVRNDVLGCQLLKMVPPQVDTVYRKLQEPVIYSAGRENSKGKKLCFT